MADAISEARAAATELMKGRDFDGAIAVLDEALAAAPSEAGLLMLRGIARSQLGDFEAGVDDLRSAAALAPRDSKIQFNLGNGLAKLGERAEASQAYQAAILADPGYEPPRLALDKLDPEALRRIDEEHLQVDPELAAAPAAAPPPPAPAADVVYGLDGEPIPNAPATSQRLAEAPMGMTSAGLGRGPSRPAYMPGSVSFVRIWFWIVYVLSVVGSLAYGAFLSYAMKQAQSVVAQGAPGMGQPSQEVLDSMPPEMRRMYEESQQRQRELMGGGGQELAQRQIKATMRIFVVGLALGVVFSTVLTLLISKGLGDGASWGYWLAMVLAFLGLLQCPLTIGYIFVIMNLNSPEAKAWCGV